MSNYPPGSDTKWAPWNEMETEQEVYCGDCDRCHQDVTVVWFGSDDDGVALCPTCKSELFIERPEPDYEYIAECKLEAQWDRDAYPD